MKKKKTKVKAAEVIAHGTTPTYRYEHSSTAVDQDSDAE